MGLDPKDQKLILKENYPNIDSSTPNSFAYFIGLAFSISSGNIAYVLPDSILVKDYAKTRKLIKPYLSQLHWYQNVGVPEDQRPFVNVEHDVCSIIANPLKSSSLICSTTYYSAAEKRAVSKRWVAEKNEMIFDEFDDVYNLMLEEKDLSILKKIQMFQKISDYLQCHEGIHTGNARDVLFVEEKKSETCRPLYYGGRAGDQISNYVSQRSGWYVDYRQDVIDKSKGLYASLRDEKIFVEPKIYITRTGNPFKAFLDENDYASNNFFSLQFKDYSQNSMDALMCILPFIISPVAQYFIRKFAAPRLGNTYVETKIIHLLNFRIPEIDSKSKGNIQAVVRKIIDQKKQNPDADVSALEAAINAEVYKLYHLTEAEIAIIEEAVK